MLRLVGGAKAQNGLAPHSPVAVDEQNKLTSKIQTDSFIERGLTAVGLGSGAVEGLSKKVKKEKKLMDTGE